MSKTLSFVVLFFSLSIVVGCGGESTDVAEAEKPVFVPADDDEAPAEPAVSEPDRTSAFEIDEDTDWDSDVGTTSSDSSDLVVEPTEDVAQLEESLRQISAAINARDTETATRLAEEAYEVNPKDPQLQQILTSLYVEAGQPDRAISILEPAVKASPGDPNTTFALAQVYMMAADQAEDDATAVTYVQASGKLIRELRTAGVFEQMGAQGPRFLVGALLNEARVLAGHGAPDDAVRALRDTFDAGFLEISSIESDESFAALADNSAFQTLLAEYGEKIRARFREEARAEMDESESFEFSFELPDLAGETVSSSGFAGKVLIVDIWGTWCGPCQMEIPHFIKLHEKFGDDLEIVGINYERCEEELVIPTIDAFVKQMGITYSCVVGDDAVRGQVPNFEGFPTTIFLDREGNVRLKVVGYHSYEKLEAIVQELVDEPKVPA
jgi:thiol-disulfide isomerase/thioredoxin